MNVKRRRSERLDEDEKAISQKCNAFLGQEKKGKIADPFHNSNYPNNS